MSAQRKRNKAKIKSVTIQRSPQVVVIPRGQTHAIKNLSGFPLVITCMHDKDLRKTGVGIQDLKMTVKKYQNWNECE